MTATRLFVPFILNGRVWRWHFAPWKDDKCREQVIVEIPMRYYAKVDGPWTARQVFITFMKKETDVGIIITQPLNARKPVLLCVPERFEWVSEISYVCNTNKMYFDSEGYPVVVTEKGGEDKGVCVQ